ncbi:hypothetical protein M3210_02980 [Oceanobacillus luteolus]|uniref:hypothetical protein n=1 Tax=Oceanobacillus luteolus TaxID=1274358 RepID=UPI00203CAE1D|nr:hypothetical protein [Oceanobacillus luteolus]MCM3739227.1 hypothetical protein [Oceanobacillus luteolus]
MDDGSVKIDIINAHFPKQLMEMVRSIYNHEKTNEHTKHLIRFELQKIFGRDTDIVGFLKDDEPL